MCCILSGNEVSSKWTTNMNKSKADESGDDQSTRTHRSFILHEPLLLDPPDLKTRNTFGLRAPSDTESPPPRSRSVTGYLAGTRHGTRPVARPVARAEVCWERLLGPPGASRRPRRSAISRPWRNAVATPPMPSRRGAGRVEGRGKDVE